MVRDVSEAVALPGLDERGITLPMHIPGLPGRQDVAIMNAGFRFSEDSPQVSAPPPAHGEHSAEVLAWLGYDERERADILAANEAANRPGRAAAGGGAGGAAPDDEPTSKR
jgi:crotonobetainyl-CoA:carnitine CoA-transferase CaiB-like acyl-CoA transferase